MKDKLPLITVVIPVYNVAQYLPRCLDSVREQTYRNCEFLVIDDGSTDGSAAICDIYAKKDPRFTVFHKQNAGISDARNFGIERAGGQYITFIDSDDYVSDDYVDYLYRLLSESGDETRISQSGFIEQRGEAVPPISGDEKRSILSTEQAFDSLLWSQGIYTSAWAKLYDIKLFRAIRFSAVGIIEDTATIYRLIDLTRTVAYGTRKTYFYCIRPDSRNMDTHGAVNKSCEFLKINEAMLTFIQEKYPHLKSGIVRYRKFSQLSALRRIVFVAQRDQSLERQLKRQILQGQLPVLLNGRSPLRDKFGILCLDLGLPFFRWCWLLYRKLTHRVV